MPKKGQSFLKGMFSYKTTLLIFVFLCCSLGLAAQFKIHFKIRSVPVAHGSEEIFVAGNFNGWDPGKEQYRFSRAGDSITLDMAGLKEGIYQFKFTRGDWKKAEVTASGSGIDNRQLKLRSDTSIEFSIDAWADDFSKNEKQHTASSNVQVLDTAFFIPQLNRSRKIWIYLPPGYAGSKKKYPVLYMHDGQNLFDDYTSAYGEWGVDECLDSMIKNGKPASIVVGIDNGPKRINEYNPYNNAEYGNGEGEAYVAFLAETLKPYIDKHFRTLSSKENTFIAGSSLGGLISYYAMLRYPDVFGKGGMFSPSFWIAPEMNQLTDSLAPKIKGQFFFYVGENESENMVSDMQLIADKLGENSSTLIYEITDPEGKHNEQAWRKWFGEFYLWVTGNGLSYQIK